jgi:hypothetical protein
MGGVAFVPMTGEVQKKEVKKAFEGTTPRKTQRKHRG